MHIVYTYLDLDIPCSGMHTCIIGIIFTAQSKSVIGPQSSFMYNNPQWTANGYTISIIGLLILAGSISIRFIKKNVNAKR